MVSVLIRAARYGGHGLSSIVSIGYVSFKISIIFLRYYIHNKTQLLLFSYLSTTAVVNAKAFLEPEGPLDQFGYVYVHNLEGLNKRGWVAWAPNIGDVGVDGDSLWGKFTADDGITNLELCAGKCESKQAPSGSWSDGYQTCWCYYSIPEESLCREPCVSDDYIDFSSTSIETLPKCAKSVCDIEWYHDEDYCHETQRMYEPDDCAALIDGPPTSSNVSCMF